MILDIDVFNVNSQLIGVIPKNNVFTVLMELFSVNLITSVLHVQLIYPLKEMESVFHVQQEPIIVHQINFALNVLKEVFMMNRKILAL